MRRIPLVLAAAILAAIPVRTAPAQTVRGQVVEQGTERPVLGAFVVLLDADGVRQDAGLTDRDGRFLVRAPAPGRYTLRAERIGHANTVSPVLELAAGETLAYRMVVPIAPIDLDAIEVSGTGRCDVPREIGAETQLLWDEARKALSIVAWLERDRGVPFRALLYERARDVVSLMVEEQTTWVRSGYGRSPFGSRSAEDLAARGYVRRLSGNVYQYFGLDAPTLLSDAFLDTHCFRIWEPDAPEEGLIGLGFEPIPTHHRPDITGVLWMDRETSELRYLEFEFTEHLHPVPIPAGPFGGRVDFRRLANGAWIVQRWRLRMPQLPAVALRGAGAPGSGRSYSDRGRLSADAIPLGLRVWEEGGEVLYIDEPGPAAAEEGHAMVAGVVYDSTRARPLEGATVFVLGTGKVATTGADGRFRINGLPPGPHEIAFIHPYADSLGIPLTPRPIALVDARLIDIDLFIPRALGCPATAGDPERATITGFVIDAETGEPAAGAHLAAEWRSRNASAMGFEGDERRLTERADDVGRFLLCGIPIGEEVRLIVRHGEDETTVELRVERPGFVERDLLVH